jgi:hypothetical protein
MPQIWHCRVCWLSISKQKVQLCALRRNSSIQCIGFGTFDVQRKAYRNAERVFQKHAWPRPRHQWPVRTLVILPCTCATFPEMPAIY